MSTQRFLSAALALGVASTPLLAQAGEEEEREYVLDDDVKVDEEEKKDDGVDWMLNAGATLSFSDNRSVVGQTDGSTFTLGFKLDSAVDYRDGDHELRNTLNVAAGLTRTPVIDDFIKSNDILAYEAIYLYHIVDWFGPYVQGAAETAMFRGTDIRAGDTTYLVARPDGTVDAPLVANRLTLTDPFHPFKLKESAGLFVQPYAEDFFTVELRLGAGGRETLAADQLAVTDDEDTDEVEVTELQDVFQFGAESVLQIWGDLYDKKLFYKASAEVMMPFVNNDDQERPVDELTNLAFKAGLSLKAVEWATVDYEFKAIREPQLIEEFQLQNNLLLTFGLSTGNIEESSEE